MNSVSDAHHALVEVQSKVLRSNCTPIWYSIYGPHNPVGSTKILNAFVTFMTLLCNSAVNRNSVLVISHRGGYSGSDFSYYYYFRAIAET